MDTRGRWQARPAYAVPRTTCPCQGAGLRGHQHAAGQCVPGHARHIERGLLERGDFEAHGEFRLLSRHHRRSDRGEGDGQGHAVGFAATGDGSQSACRRLQQRLRLRLSELPFVVGANNAAAFRSASARGFRAPVRRRRQRGRAARGAPEPRQSARCVHIADRPSEAARRRTRSRPPGSIRRQRAAGRTRN